MLKLTDLNYCATVVKVEKLVQLENYKRKLRIVYI